MRVRGLLRQFAAKLAVVSTLAGATASCGEPPQTSSVPPPISAEVISSPRPIATPAPKTVAASFYARFFSGRKTTSGEVYNPNKLTAASKTLPLGTVVELKNPKNQHTVRVKVNDRGPFVRGRSLDLSHRAAAKLGIVKEGVAPVKIVKVIPPGTAQTTRLPGSQTADTDAAASLPH